MNLAEGLCVASRRYVC